MEAEIPMELWEPEIQAGPFCNQKPAKATVKTKKGWGGGGGGMISNLCQIFFLLCIWENEHMWNDSNRKDWKWKKIFFMYYVLNECN